jgi:hypothetical protein
MAQNKIPGRKRQENIPPQKTNNSIEDLGKNEGNERSPVE